MNKILLHLKRSIEVQLLVFSLILVGLPINSYASSVNEQELNELINAQAMFVRSRRNNPVSDNPLYKSRAAKELFQRTQNFINSPSNQGLLQTPAGVSLLSGQKYFTSYNSIAKEFERCRIEDSKRNLDLRILDTVMDSRAKTNPCYAYRGFETVDDAFNQIHNLMDKSRGKASDGFYNKFSSLQDKLHWQALENSAKTYLSLRHRYEPAFIGKDGIRDDHLEMAVKDLCQDLCSDDDLAKLNRYVQQESRVLGQKPKVKSYADAAKQVNGKFKRLNEKLKAVPIKTVEGWFRNGIMDTSDPDPGDETSKAAFNEYVQSFMQEANQEDGFLMFTDIIRKKSGGLKEFKKDDMKKTTGSKETTFNFTKHKENALSKNDMFKAKNEVQKKIKAQVLQLHKMNANKIVENDEWEANDKKDDDVIWKWDRKDINNKRSEDLKTLIATNPAAVGQVLLNNPEQAGMVCSLINEIQQDDKTKKRNDKLWFYGGMVVGVGLAVTGIGLGLGGAVIANSAAAATLATYSSAAFALSTAAELSYGTYKGTRAYEHIQDFDRFEAAFLTGNSDDHSVVEAQEALAEFKEARFEAALSIGFSALDIAGMSTLTKGSRLGANVAKVSGKVMSPRQMNALSKLYQGIKASKLGGVFRQARQLMGKVGGKKMDRFLTFLSQSKEGLRIRFLEALKRKGVGPVWLKNAVDESLDAAGKQCKL